MCSRCKPKHPAQPEDAPLPTGMNLASTGATYRLPPWAHMGRHKRSHWPSASLVGTDMPYGRFATALGQQTHMRWPNSALNWALNVSNQGSLCAVINVLWQHFTMLVVAISAVLTFTHWWTWNVKPNWRVCYGLGLEPVFLCRLGRGWQPGDRICSLLHHLSWFYPFPKRPHSMPQPCMEFFNPGFLKTTSCHISQSKTGSIVSS